MLCKNFPINYFTKYLTNPQIQSTSDLARASLSIESCVWQFGKTDWQYDLIKFKLV